MSLLLTKAFTKLTRKRYALFKALVIWVLILSLTACGGKAAGQDVSIVTEKPVKEKNAQLSSKISEVAPPEVIQELHQTLEVYQPQVQILNIQSDEVLKQDKLKVRFQVTDLPIFKDSRYELGSHLQVVLDNQPGLEIYDLNQPLELADLSPGTHTLRVFASYPWHESFKNEGAYAQTTFHVFTKSDDNNPDTNLPILTYNSPEGSYGAEPILLDFFLTNAPLHILAKDNPDNPISDWRIRCTINGESFIIDRWQSIYLKGFNTGQNWVKLEFLDNQGNLFKNVFNSAVRVINYEPKAKDTLAKLVKGELSAEDLRGIVDADYASKIPQTETPQTQLQQKSEESEDGFFNRFKRDEEKTETKQPVVPIPGIITPQPETELEQTIPEVIQTPQPETELEETIPEVIETPELETDLKETIPEVIETPQPETELEETIPEVIETPQLETNKEKPQVEVTPIPVAPQAEESQPGGYFNRFKRGEKSSAGGFFDRFKRGEKDQKSVPEVMETPIPAIPQAEESQPDGYFNRFEDSEDETTPQAEESSPDGFFNRFKRGKEDKKSIPLIKTPTPELEIKPELPPTLPEIVEPSEIPQPQIKVTPETQQPTTEKLKEYFNLPQNTTPLPTPEVEVPSVPVIEQ